MSDKSVPSAQRRQVPEDLGRQFLEAFSPWRSQILSLHDSLGETLWLSEGSIGPDEHDVVLAALDVFALEPRRTSIYRKLEDGRRALFLVARDPLGGCSGIVFGIIEGGDVDERRVITPAIRALLQRFSMLMAPPVERRASMAAAHARTQLEFGSTRAATRVCSPAGARAASKSPLPRSAPPTMPA
jgi:hypothetical protein